MTVAAVRSPLAIPDDLITFRVSVLSQLLAGVVDASVSRELGLTSRQWRVLMTLDRIGTSIASDIARFASLDLSQVSRVVQELVTKGLVLRSPGVDDRRKQLLALAPAARRVLDAGLVGSRARQARLAGCLSAAELEVFGKALAALTAEARTMLTESRRNARGPAADPRTKRN